MRPERILQFGEGNFLRAFVDWMVDGMNRQGLFDGSIVVVQPIPRGTVDKLNEQEGRYTLVLRGLDAGQPVEYRQRIESIARGIDPYVNYDEFFACARNPLLRFIVSNTTEAGIVFNPADRPTDRPPSSFPGKLTAFLYERWRLLPDLPFVLLPCELIDRNGDILRRTVLQTAQHWDLDGGFHEWVERANVFANTLVDRIVPGFAPIELPYKDDLICTGELFHFWAIEAPDNVARELPLRQAGFNVVWTQDLKPYRDRKVRLLNGAHTSLALAAYLAGLDTVRSCMEHESVSRFVERLLFQEVMPTLSLPRNELESFAASVLERFRNPYIEHKLLSISLNSVSKYRTRVLPTVEEFVALRGDAPPLLSFALAGLIAFYRGTTIDDGALIGDRRGTPYRIVDDAAVLEAFAHFWREESPSGVVKSVLSREDWWGSDLRSLPGLAQATTDGLHAILQLGAAEAMKQAIGKSGVKTS